LDAVGSAVSHHCMLLSSPSLTAPGADSYSHACLSRMGFPSPQQRLVVYTSHNYKGYIHTLVWRSFLK
jgi:hypothetical protein